MQFISKGSFRICVISYPWMFWHESHKAEPHTFFCQGFFHRHWRFTGQQEKRGDYLLFTSTRSWTFRHLYATLHVRWLSRIFNWNAFVYQTATRWDLPPYWITIWLTEWWCNVYLFTSWFDSRFLLQQFDMGNRWLWTHSDYYSAFIFLGSFC